MQKMEKAEFKTSDGFLIKGSLIPKGVDAVLMLHQFQFDKSSYNSLSQKIVDGNFTALAIDFRGHGESNLQNGAKRELGVFSGQDFRDMEKDVAAAKAFLEENGFELKVIIGSSIGANTALNFAAAHSTVEKIVLLSPGLNYKGISTQENAPNVKAKALIVASMEDSYGFSSSQTLAQQIPNSEFRQLANAGHGTNMFKGTDLENEIGNWIAK